MQRYFLEVSYKGANYSGFQIQENASSVQAEIEKVLTILQKKEIPLTGSSRTDTGVHAVQNFFHFDFEGSFHPHFLYQANSILPKDIVIKNIYSVLPEAHCRFSAISRTYHYHVYRTKNPFLEEYAYYFPYTIDYYKLQEAATIIKTYKDFTSFSKRNTQAKTFLCNIVESDWKKDGEQFIYRVKSNRFLRGMVRGLTGTMLQVGRGKISIDDFKKIIEAKDCRKADFAVPGCGLFLMNVEFADNLQLLPLYV
jgi:tRNA pseudouridine38-40 synthase